MLTRIALLKLKKEHLDKKRQLIELCLDLANSSQDVLSANVQENIINQDKASDIIYIATFKDKASWEIYDKLPTHNKLRETVTSWCAAASFITYEDHD